MTDPEPLLVRWQRLRLEERLFGRRAELRVGRFILGERIGYGGMGSVYEGTDPSLDRTVALKMLHPRWFDRPGAAARLAREAKAMAKLAHPNVVTVYEVGVEDDQPYIAMELMPGGTLAEWLIANPPGTDGRREFLVRALHQCTAGLIAAHAAGFVHRDFKPLNVLLTADGVAKVADFGLVQLAAEGWSDEDDPPSSPDAFAMLDTGSPLTAGGTAPGTPRYMAPEQRDGFADAATDQFALCKTFLEALGNEPDPQGLLPILARGTRDDPAERHPDLVALQDALEHALRPPPRSRALPAAIAMVLLGGAGWAAVAAQRGPTEAIVACEDERESFDAAWSEAQQAQIRVAFERSGHGSWRRAWDGAKTRIDAYVDAWAQARLDACEATRIRRVQDERTMARRMACLDQRREAVRLLSEAYLSADANVVADAIDTADALPKIARCAERDELELGDSAGGLNDPRVRAGYDALGRADSLRTQGRYEEADRAYLAVIPDLEAMNAPTLLARAYRHRSYLVCEKGGYEDAAALARMALDQAERGQSPTEIFSAWTQMSSVARLSGDYDAAELYLERADGIAERHPEAAGLRFEIAEAWGHHLGARGRSEEALEAFRRAAALADEVDAGTLSRLQIRMYTLTELTLLGRDDEALQLGEALLADAIELYGPDHPRTLTVQSIHAQIFLERGQWERATDLTKAALELDMDQDRADFVVVMRGKYTAALMGQGEFDEARRVMERTMDEATPILGSDHQNVVTMKLQLAQMLVHMEDYAAAREALAASKDLVGTEPEGDAGGKLHPMNRCMFWLNATMADVGSEHVEDALESLRITTGICGQAASPESIFAFKLQMLSGTVHEAAEDQAAALEAFERADALTKTVQVEPKDREQLDGALARLRPGAR